MVLRCFYQTRHDFCQNTIRQPGLRHFTRQRTVARPSKFGAQWEKSGTHGAMFSSAAAAHVCCILFEVYRRCTLTLVFHSSLQYYHTPLLPCTVSLILPHSHAIIHLFSHTIHNILTVIHSYIHTAMHPNCHAPILSLPYCHSHTVILTHTHTITLSYCDTATPPYCHTHTVILPHLHTVTLIL